MKRLALLLCVAPTLFAAQYIDPIRNIRFDYDDATWELKETPVKAQAEEVDKNMAQKTIVNLQMRQADEKYHSRFSIVSDDASKIKKTKEGIFKDYQKHTVEFLKSQRFDILSIKEAKLAKVAEPAFEIMANQRDFGLLFRQVVFLKGETAYLLTAATRTKKYETYAKELDKIFDSVEISNPNTVR